jgi:TRAP-type mannitol/chloroaromatic compound transport system permease small subunit
VKHRNSRVREIAFHTLFCMVSMVSILLTMQKKIHVKNDPLHARITMREFQFFESIIEKIFFLVLKSPYIIFHMVYYGIY